MSSPTQIGELIETILDWSSLIQDEHRSHGRHDLALLTEQQSEAAVETVKDLLITLEMEWRVNHDDRCSNVGNCSTFTPGARTCCLPRPDVLQSGLSLIAQDLEKLRTED